MRKLATTALVFLLAGCGAGQASEAASSAGPSSSVDASPTTPGPAPEPTETTAEPSDLSTQREGENIIYRFAEGKLSLVAPTNWTPVVESSRAFPVALASEDGSERVVVGEIGPADLAPGMEAYAGLLAERLGLDAEQVVYLGQDYLGVALVPAFQVVGEGYVARVYLATLNGTLYEVSIRGADDAALQQALSIAASVEIS